MMLESNLTMVLPLVVGVDPDKIVAPLVAIIEDGKIKLGVIPSIIYERSYQKYQELVKDGYKPVNMEPDKIAVVLKVAMDTINGLFIQSLIESVYDKELVDKLGKMIEAQVKALSNDSLVR